MPRHGLGRLCRTGRVPEAPGELQSHHERRLGPDLERPSSADGPDNSAPADASRRTFLLRAIGAISALIAAILAIPPVVGFASAAGGPAVLYPAATPRGIRSRPPSADRDGCRLGNLDEILEVGVPRAGHVLAGHRRRLGLARRGACRLRLPAPRGRGRRLRHPLHPPGLPARRSASGAGRFLCPCHGGSSTSRARCWAGPPPRPMAPVRDPGRGRRGPGRPAGGGLR